MDDTLQFRHVELLQTVSFLLCYSVLWLDSYRFATINFWYQLCVVFKWNLSKHLITNELLCRGLATDKRTTGPSNVDNRIKKQALHWFENSVQCTIIHNLELRGAFVNHEISTAVICYLHRRHSAIHICANAHACCVHILYALYLHLAMLFAHILRPPCAHVMRMRVF